MSNIGRKVVCVNDSTMSVQGPAYRAKYPWKCIPPLKNGNVYVIEGETRDGKGWLLIGVKLRYDRFPNFVAGPHKSRFRFLDEMKNEAALKKSDQQPSPSTFK